MADTIDIAKKTFARRTFQNKYSSIEDGKLQPQAVEVEEAILGSIMLEKDAIEDVITLLNEECFYVDKNMRIWKAMRMLYEESSSIDLLTVVEQLKKNGDLDAVGGPFYISQLTNKIGSSANIEFHARVIQEKYFLRQLINTSTEVVKDAFEDSTDVFNLLDKASAGISVIMENGNKGDIRSMGAGVMQELKDIGTRMSNDSHIIGVETGFQELNQTIGGWQKTDLIVVAARPGVGKTSFLLSLAINAALAEKNPVPVGIFSLEMSTSQLIMRGISSEIEISTEKLRQGKLNENDWNRLTSGLDRLRKAPIYIDDTPALSLMELKAKARLMKKRYGIEILFIDYLQLMSGGSESGKYGGNREQEISSISRGLKTLAKELGIPVIALAQLSRSVETRGGDKIPILSDLRECLSTETSLIYTQKGALNNATSRINLLSLSKDFKIANMESDNIPKSKNTVYRLKLKSGRFLDATLKHEVLTSDGYKKLKDITKDDSVACALNFTTENTKYYPESKFIGWMIGNGCMYGYNVPSFVTPDAVVAENFKKYIKKTFGFEAKDHPHYKSKVYQYDVTKDSVRVPGGNPVTSFLKERDLWGRKAKDKYIPEWFMESADNQSIYEIIQGLWETDGSIAISKSNRGAIQYSTTSFLLAQQILYLLAKIGIYGNVDDGYLSDKATTECYKIIIEDAEFKKVFVEKIKLDGDKGKKLASLDLSICRANYLNNKIGLKTTNDLIAMVRGNGLTRKNVNLQGNGKRATRQILLKACEELTKINKRFKHMDMLVSKNIYWDVVDSVTKIGVRPVFDRSVPSTNNFIVNGIIAHNSGAIENDADIVIFLYRGEYYGLTVDSDGNSNVGMADIIIAKHRNGALKKIRARFIGSCTKFMDINEMPNDDRMPQSNRIALSAAEIDREPTQYASMKERAKQNFEMTDKSKQNDGQNSLPPYAPPADDCPF